MTSVPSKFVVKHHEKHYNSCLIETTYTRTEIAYTCVQRMSLHIRVTETSWQFFSISLPSGIPVAAPSICVSSTARLLNVLLFKTHKLIFGRVKPYILLLRTFLTDDMFQTRDSRSRWGKWNNICIQKCLNTTNSTQPQNLALAYTGAHLYDINSKWKRSWR